MSSSSEFIEFLQRTMRALVGEESFTESVSAAMEEQIIREFGGGPVYVLKINRDAIRESVRREFNGRNRRELCRKHGIGRSTFYRMLKGRG